MKAAFECYGCLKKLIEQAAYLATKDSSLRQRAIKSAMNILRSKFSYSQMPIVLATKFHNIIKEITGNPDPYREMKEKEIATAREIYPRIISQYKNDLKDCVKLAVVANAIDFFREIGEAEADLQKIVNLTLDDSDILEGRLRDSSNVLYLADNAGEVYFDLPLFRWMKRFAYITYVVKSAAVQDDITMEDLKKTGLEGEFGRIITTGVASPGIIFDLASDEFKREFKSADLVFAKGMGYYESLSEFPMRGKIFYCLKAKCKPVADSLEVPLNSYVAKFC
ncbi:MAG: ARMT1-like domain-containing protein [Thermodesulfovibrionales bacterium]|nr:ARMT1-like domain-containing protein [Thermodesulfovibrionales bacterium]